MCLQLELVKHIKIEVLLKILAFNSRKYAENFLL